MTDETRAVKRFSRKLPGHDCIRNPCGRGGCGTHPGSNHGIASETWIYAVSDGTVALSLRISSGVYPASVPTQLGCYQAPAGISMDEHHAFPISKEQLLAEPEECEYLDGGACYGGLGSGLAAEAFCQKHVVATFEQPPSFWERLTEELRERAAALQAERVDDKLVRCRCCGGSGVVELLPPEPSRDTGAIEGPQVALDKFNAHRGV